MGKQLVEFKKPAWMEGFRQLQFKVILLVDGVDHLAGVYMSKWCPQGTLLEPLLFNIFTNVHSPPPMMRKR